MIEKCKLLFSLQGFYGILLSLLLKIISSQLVVLDNFGVTHLDKLFNEIILSGSVFYSVAKRRDVPILECKILIGQLTSDNSPCFEKYC